MPVVFLGQFVILLFTHHILVAFKFSKMLKQIGLVICSVALSNTQPFGGFGGSPFGNSPLGGGFGGSPFGNGFGGSPFGGFGNGGFGNGGFGNGGFGNGGFGNPMSFMPRNQQPASQPFGGSPQFGQPSQFMPSDQYAAPSPQQYWMPNQQVQPQAPQGTTAKPEPELPLRCVLSTGFMDMPFLGCAGTKSEGWTFDVKTKTCKKTKQCQQQWGYLDDMNGFPTEEECLKTCIIEESSAAPAGHATHAPVVIMHNTAGSEPVAPVTLN